MDFILTFPGLKTGNPYEAKKFISTNKEYKNPSPEFINFVEKVAEEKGFTEGSIIHFPSEKNDNLKKELKDSLKSSPYQDYEPITAVRFGKLLTILHVKS